jgi:hypothetical protein
MGVFVSALGLAERIERSNEQPATLREEQRQEGPTEGESEQELPNRFGLR